MQQTKLNLMGSHEIKPLSERIKEERSARLDNAKTKLSFGLQYLDDSLNGIQKDLVLVGAYSGVGKTELVTHIAQTNVREGKRVHVFALEAEKNEIERRLKYKVLAELFYTRLVKGGEYRFKNVTLDYADWNAGLLDDLLGKYEPEIEDIIGLTYPTLYTIYREFGDYTAEVFEKQFQAIQDQTDLVIVDHLHYFDLDDENENRAMKRLVKKIRDVSLLVGKPVILVAHVRKKDRRYKSVIPELDDFMGTSDIGKIATKAVMLAPADMPGKTLTRFPTFIRAVKNRPGSARTKLCALTSFDITTNTYQDKYYLGREGAEHEFEPITNPNDLPHWAKGAIPYGQ